MEGVTRPATDGVIRPFRLDATEGGRDIAVGPTVGAESLAAAMKTPQLGGQEKYCFLLEGKRSQRSS